MKKKDLLKKIEALETRVLFLEAQVERLQEGGRWTWPMELQKFDLPPVTKGTSCEAGE